MAQQTLQNSRDRIAPTQYLLTEFNRPFFCGTPFQTSAIGAVHVLATLLPG
jgi:hypothetical protein